MPPIIRLPFSLNMFYFAQFQCMARSDRP